MWQRPTHDAWVLSSVAAGAHPPERVLQKLEVVEAGQGMVHRSWKSGQKALLAGKLCAGAVDGESAHFDSLKLNA